MQIWLSSNVAAMYRAPAVITALVLLLAVIGMTAAAPAFAVEPPEQIKRKQADLKDLRARIEAVEQNLAEVRKDQSSLAASVRETEQDISAMSGSLRELDEKLAKRKREAEKFERQRDRIQGTLEKQMKLLGLQLRSSYVAGRQQKVKLLLNQEDPAVLGRMLAFYEYLTEARTRSIEGIKEELLSLIDMETSLQDELARLRTLREERAARLAELETKRNERSRQLAAMEKEVASSGKELSRLKHQEDSLEKLIQALRENLQIPPEFRNAKPFDHSKGRLPWPMKGSIIAHYGQRKRGTSLTWKGVWIGGKTGTPIRAVSSGRVVYVGWLHRYGLIVLMEHPGGYYSLYGHNQEALVSVGDSLKAGQILARAGDSGGHRNSGVYFEIRKGKNPVNPLAWLQR